jgi:hypothetical protein
LVAYPAARAQGVAALTLENRKLAVGQAVAEEMLMLSEPKRRQIYDRAWGQCPPYPLTEPWQGLPPGPEVRYLPTDAAATIQVLLEDATPDELCQAGVAVQAEAGQLELDPRLSGSGGLVLALHDDASGPPYDLVTEAGCISGPTLAVCAGMRDIRIREFLEQARVLCVAPSLADVAALLAGGMPAIVSAGLDQLRRGTLDQFCEDLGFDRPEGPWSARGVGTIGAVREVHARTKRLLADAEAARARGERPEPFPLCLALVGWSPAFLSTAPPEKLEPVRARLRDIHELLGIAMDTTFVWQPQPSDLVPLQFALENGSRADIQQALLTNVVSSSAPLIAPPGTANPVLADPTDFPGAQANLRTVSRLRGERYVHQHAWRMFEQLLDRDLIAPLQQQAATAADPLDRNLLAAMAQLSRRLQVEAALGCQRLSAAIEKGGVTAGDAQLEADVKRLMDTSGRLLAIARESQRLEKKHQAGGGKGRWRRKP